MVVPAVPYRGIQPFRFADHPIFFARERETRQLIRLVDVYRGVFLYADSGDGKSSLVNVREVCQLIGTGLSRSDWEQYAPGIPYRDSCA